MVMIAVTFQAVLVHAKVKAFKTVLTMPIKRIKIEAHTQLIATVLLFLI